LAVNNSPWKPNYDPGSPNVPTSILRGSRVGHGATVVNGQMRNLGFATGVSGWSIYADGTVEFNDGNFRGDITGASGTFSGSISGGTIDIGGNDSSSFHVDVDGNMWLGAATYVAAPFKVSNTGSLTATTGTFSGNISGGTIDIGGADNSSFHVDVNGNMWLGAATYAAAPFKVSNTGSLTATTGTFSGDISGATGTFTGDLSGSNITGGTLTIGTGNAIFKINSTGDHWSGNANLASAPFKVTSGGVLTAANGTFTNATVTDATITNGTLSVGTGSTIFKVDSGGNHWSGNAVFGSAPFRVSNAGALTATNANITGTFQTGTTTDYIVATAGGNVLDFYDNNVRVGRIKYDSATNFDFEIFGSDGTNPTIDGVLGLGNGLAVLTPGYNHQLNLGSLDSGATNRASDVFITAANATHIGQGSGDIARFSRGSSVGTLKMLSGAASSGGQIVLDHATSGSKEIQVTNVHIGSADYLQVASEDGLVFRMEVQGSTAPLLYNNTNLAANRKALYVDENGYIGVV